ncbi:MAG TPA: hydrogen peroxide-dependent heme synthase [Longimicrobiales bacterium]|nr:hydrogen peroxide-dependent heme synthase [Longimicrobiales bacterium]
MSELAPATLEGWYALHQMMAIDWTAVRAMPAVERANMRSAATDLITSISTPSEAGWSGVYQLVGGMADLMFVHFRETLDDLGRVDMRLRRSRPGAALRLEHDYTSVTEAGLYHATAEAAAEAKPLSKEFDRLLEEAAAAERASPHVETRLFPRVPDDMRYVSFYPMSKRRVHPDNWYSLPVTERNRLMREHGLTGRRYAGRVFQVITGSTGLDDWEWGVTLFAKDPLEFKRIVTEMRYDEASAKYGEFGEFFTGVKLTASEFGALFDVD